MRPTSPATPSSLTAASSWSPESPSQNEDLSRPILKRALALELHFHESELGISGVDDIVLDAGLPEVGATGDKLGLGRRLRALEPKRAAKYGHDDVVELVPMQARRLARREPPLGHANALVVDLDGRRRLRSAHGGDFTLHP